MKILSVVIYLLFMVSLTSLSAQGFLKVEGQRIVDGEGKEIILRGMGLGGWMLQEPYMMQTSSVTSAQYEIKEKIEALIGKQDAEEFYQAWLENHCRKADIDSLASWGFNSVRLPMHYNLYTLPVEDESVPGENTWLETGFRLTDSLLSWCESNNMYLILDLHAAPGGQGYDQAISDYDPSKPSLWESEENRSKTVALWKKLAERYADEPWIGGYDLINEVNWELQGNALLKILYLNITSAIREVDNNHIIFIEGNWFANDFTGLTPPWDDNMVYSFHKYWSYNDQNSIQWMLDMRNLYDIPIWCGEAGENSNVWFREAISLFESNDIGWAWWPLKKVESISGPLSIIKPSGYQTLIDYWEGNAPKPSAEFARQALLRLAENSKTEKCIFQRDVIDAMLRQVGSLGTVPFRKHELPGTLPAVEFDMGRESSAYHDTDIANYQLSSGSFTAWNTGWTFRNDGVDIEKTADGQNSPYSVGWTADGEWMIYTVDILHEDTYTIHFRVASPDGGGRLKLEVDNEILIDDLNVPETGGWYSWQNLSVNDVSLPQGTHSIKVTILKSGFNFKHMEFIADSNGFGDNDPEVPDDIDLGQNYPNPFNSGTTIPFKLTQNVAAEIIIFNQRGQVVRTLDPGEQNFVIWDGLNSAQKVVGSGVYYYQLRTGTDSRTKKMLLLN